MASTLRKNLEDQVTCPICQEHFTDPRLLPCLHTYCKKCLDDLIRAASGRGQVSCPECREIVQINDADEFKVHFQMNNLISLLAISSLEEETKTTELVCENCRSNDRAAGRCMDCCKFMCDFCIKAHHRFLDTEDHRVMSLDEVKKQGTPAMSQRLKCAKHKDEVMKLYCESCKQLICRDCTIIDHREHCYQFIDDVAEQHKKSLNAALEGAIDAASEIEKNMKTVGEMKSKIKEKCCNLEEEIEKEINEQIEALKQKERTLKAHVRKHTGERMACLEKQGEALETSLKNLKSSIQFTQDTLQANDNVTILSISSEANNRLSALIEEVVQLDKKPCKKDNFRFQVEKESIKQSIHNGMFITEDSYMSQAEIYTSPEEFEGDSLGSLDSSVSGDEELIEEMPELNQNENNYRPRRNLYNVFMLPSQQQHPFHDQPQQMNSHGRKNIRNRPFRGRR